MRLQSRASRHQRRNGLLRWMTAVADVVHGAPRATGLSRGSNAFPDLFPLAHSIILNTNPLHSLRA